MKNGHLSNYLFQVKAWQLLLSIMKNTRFVEFPHPIYGKIMYMLHIKGYESVFPALYIISHQMSYISTSNFNMWLCHQGSISQKPLSYIQVSLNSKADAMIFFFNLCHELLLILTLLFSAVREEASSLETTFVFGAGLDLDLLGIEIDDKTLVPGLAVTSSRAKPLAGIYSSCIFNKHIILGRFLSLCSFYPVH